MNFLPVSEMDGNENKETSSDDKCLEQEDQNVDDYYTVCEEEKVADDETQLGVHYDGKMWLSLLNVLKIISFFQMANISNFFKFHLESVSFSFVVGLANKGVYSKEVTMKKSELISKLKLLWGNSL